MQGRTSFSARDFRGFIPPRRSGIPGAGGFCQNHRQPLSFFRENPGRIHGKRQEHGTPEKRAFRSFFTFSLPESRWRSRNPLPGDSPANTTPNYTGPPNTNRIPPGAVWAAIPEKSECSPTAWRPASAPYSGIWHSPGYILGMDVLEQVLLHVINSALQIADPIHTDPFHAPNYSHFQRGFT